MPIGILDLSLGFLHSPHEKAPVSSVKERKGAEHNLPNFKFQMTTLNNQQSTINQLLIINY